MPTICPIVGAYHRPPAQALLAHLPLSFPLLLRREPTNQFDPYAIMVVLRTADLEALNPELLAQISSACAGYGYTQDDLLATAEWHVGYIPKAAAPALGQAMLKYWTENLPEDPAFPAETPGTLATLTTGAPAIKLDLD